MVKVGLIILVLVEVLLARGQNTCDTCANDTEYIACVSREFILCSTVGTNFICVPDAPRDTLCQPPPPGCAGQGKFLFKGLTDECDRYYECDSALVATIKFCTGGQLFSEAQQDCVAPADSECLSMTASTVVPTESSSATESPEPTTEVVTSPDTSPDTSPVTSPVTTTPSDSSTAVTTVQPIECTRIGRIPDPTSCRRFYSCIWRPLRRDFIKLLRTCPFRLLYDTQRRMCRFNTQCGNRLF